MGTRTSARDYDPQEVDNLEHDPDLHVKKAMPYGWTGTAAVAIKTNSAGELMMSSLIPEKYDYLSFSYTGSNLTGIVFKTGGAGGTTVATLTLGYDGSNNLTSIART